MKLSQALGRAFILLLAAACTRQSTTVAPESRKTITGNQQESKKHDEIEKVTKKCTYLISKAKLYHLNLQYSPNDPISFDVRIDSKNHTGLLDAVGQNQLKLSFPNRLKSISHLEVTLSQNSTILFQATSKNPVTCHTNEQVFPIAFESPKTQNASIPHKLLLIEWQASNPRTDSKNWSLKNKR